MGQELRSSYSYWPTLGLCTRLLARGPSVLAGWVLAGLSFSSTVSHIWFSWSQWTQRESRMKIQSLLWIDLRSPTQFLLLCSSVLWKGCITSSPHSTGGSFFFFFLTNYWIKKIYLFIWLPWILVALWSILYCSVQTQVVVPGSEVSAPTCSVAFGILLPQSGTELRSPAWQGRFFFFFNLLRVLLDSWQNWVEGTEILTHCLPA